LDTTRQLALNTPKRRANCGVTGHHFAKMGLEEHEVASAMIVYHGSAKPPTPPQPLRKLYFECRERDSYNSF
jgi:hypothetical protein